MLNLAKGLCAVVLPDAKKASYFFNKYTKFEGGIEPRAYPPFDNIDDSPFIRVNADKEMWLYLCSRFSPPLVRVYEVTGGGPTSDAPDRRNVELRAIYYADGYPSTAPVLDHKRVVVNGVHPDNYYPACVRMPTAPGDVAWLQTTKAWTKYHMPPCPAEFLAQAKVMWQDSFTTPEMSDNMARWDLRGAIATGMSVFSYLQGGGAQTQVTPYYNQCQLLK
jgi:hypothetical protein